MAFDILNDDLGSMSSSDLFGGGGAGWGGKQMIPKDPGMSFPDDNSTPGNIFGTDLPTNYDPVSGKIGGGSVWDSLQSVLGSSGGASSAAPAGTASGGGFSDWLKNFVTGQPGQGFLSGLGPYAAVAGIGITQAQKAQKDAEQRANELKSLGQPYSAAGQQQLSQFQGGQLRPEQQQFVNLSQQFGTQLDEAATPLGKIAQQAFTDYNSGKLGSADELRIQNQVAAQKQQVRQMMANSGITDSSVLAGQDQQIDNQAQIMRQDLLDKRFATGNQAYDQWLKTTSEGQQLKLSGQKFASDSFEQMLNDALGLGAEGMQPAMEAIQLQIQSDADLSQTVSELLGNLASAYSYAMAGPGHATSGGGGGAPSGGGGSSSNGLSQIISGISGVSNIVGKVGDIFGFEGAGGQAAGLFGKIPGIGSLGGAIGAFSSGSKMLDEWQQGDVGGGAWAGAQTGAALGSIIPGLGTLVGGGIGAVVGGLGSLIQGKDNPEEKTRDKYYQAVMQGQNASPELFTEGVVGEFRAGQSTYPPRKGGYGPKDDDKFAYDMATKINQAYSAGQIGPNDNPQSVLEKVVAPWMDTMGGGWKASKAPQKQLAMTLDMVQRYMSGSAIDWNTARGRKGDYDMPSYPKTGKKTIQPVKGAYA